MTKVVWDNVGDRGFELGLDRGVLYTSDTGVPWNGLISVDAKQDGTAAKPVYYDGLKYNEVVFIGDFAANLTAYTYPDEFLPFDGFSEVATGIFVDGQDRDTFGLSYRTLIGNDTEGTSHGYKINLLYNLTAIPDDVTSKTADTNVEPIEFSWALTSIPDPIPGLRPSSRLIVNSTKVDSEFLVSLEDILYGTESTDPRLPSILEIYSMLYLEITDNLDGSWDATAPETLIKMLDDNTFEITAGTISYSNEYTYSIS